MPTMTASYTECRKLESHQNGGFLSTINIKSSIFRLLIVQLLDKNLNKNGQDTMQGVTFFEFLAPHLEGNI